MENKTKVFLNPFDKGVSYSDFSKALKESKKTLKDYTKNHLTESQIEFLDRELKLLTKVKK